MTTRGYWKRFPCQLMSPSKSLRSSLPCAFRERSKAGAFGMTVDEDAIQVSDGPLRTAPGVTAGLDLALDRHASREPACNVFQAAWRADAVQPQGRSGAGGPGRASGASALGRDHPALDHSMADLAKRMDFRPAPLIPLVSQRGRHHACNLGRRGARKRRAAVAQARE
jgi:hypothetical protein